ncbi:putative membrane transporter protein YfcA [bioreactor metagenome]|uniref:Putative membrane transporter protein YfcA n=1 Tax=bioreactor metagenome TaxID=1076179 RepID=A0A645HPF2_9ZZZZ
MRGGAVRFEDCYRPFAICFAGAAAGALSVQFLDPELLKKAIPALLITVGLYMLFQPKVGETDLHPRLRKGWFDFWFGLGIGFYDGFLGPGTGTFWTIAYVTLQGYNLTRATAHTKVMNFASNVSALLLFAAGGKVLVLPGLVMAGGQLLGARLGARMVLARGARFIRPVFLAAVLAMTIKLLVDTWRV